MVESCFDDSIDGVAVALPAVWSDFLVDRSVGHGEIVISCDGWASAEVFIVTLILSGEPSIVGLIVRSAVAVFDAIDSECEVVSNVAVVSAYWPGIGIEACSAFGIELAGDLVSE